MQGIAVTGRSFAVAAWVSAVCAAQPQGAPDYAKDIEPLLRTACYGCHSGAQPVGKLRLDVKKAAMAGAIVPGRSRESRIVRRVMGLDGAPRMPLGGKPLEEAQVALLARWIDAGAPWPDAPAAAEPQAHRHWAYVKPVRPAPPPVRDAAWVRNPIDAFVLARLEKEGLAPSPEADRARR